MLFRVNQYFGLIIRRDEKTTLHECVIGKGGRMLSDISKRGLGEEAQRAGALSAPAEDPAIMH